MKRIQQIILAFMLGIVPLQSVWAVSKADELVEAASNGDLEQVKTLIEKEGIDINARETEYEIGETALISASTSGQLEVVKYLISKGADVNVVAKIDEKMLPNSTTALDFAKTDVIKEVLKNAGAKSAKEIKK